MIISNNLLHIKRCYLGPQKTIFINNKQKNDVFVRTLGFGSNNYDSDKTYASFCKWAKETAFLENILDITESTDNILGSGFEGVVYKIPKTENWVIKRYKRSDFLPISNQESKIVQVEDISPNLNIGQPIAQIQIPANSTYSHVFYIQKKQTGVPLGVSHIESRSISELKKKIHIQSLGLLANAPQSTYDKCIEDIERIAQIGYEIDCSNTNNFLFDKKNQRINFIDINDKSTLKKEQYSDVLYALLGGNFAITFNKKNENELEKKVASELSNKIIAKFIKAMNTHNKKFSNSNFFSIMMNEEIFSKLINLYNK